MHSSGKGGISPVNYVKVKMKTKINGFFLKNHAFL
jgi:hypothetical protein